MHEVSPPPSSPSHLAFPLTPVEYRGKCFPLTRAFRSTASAGLSLERGRMCERKRGTDREEEGETVGILITLGSRLRALPQQPRHFSRSYSAAKKKSALALPHTSRQNPFGIALPWNSTMPNSVDSFSNEKTTHALSPRLVFSQKVSRQTKRIRATQKEQLRCQLQII